jgi:hypothetical protein
MGTIGRKQFQIRFDDPEKLLHALELWNMMVMNLKQIRGYNIGSSGCFGAL